MSGQPDSLFFDPMTGMLSGFASSTQGVFSISMTAFNGMNNAFGFLTLTVGPPDTTPPVITLNGSNPMTVIKGSVFTDPGASVTDNIDPPQTIVGTGSVNTALVGSYTLSYSVTDAAGNSASATRTVNVVNSTNANLSALLLGSGTLSPTFSSNTTNYTASVSNSVSSTTVRPTAAQTNAAIQVRVNNGSFSNVASSALSSALPLNTGSNPIDVRVTAQDGTTTKTYTVTVTRAASANADLSALSLSSGTLSPAFAGATTNYTANVANAVAALSITPTVSQSNAVVEVRVNGGTFASVTSGNASGALALNAGSNTLDVRVTAQDGSTSKTYTVTVTRDVNSAPTISTISDSTFNEDGFAVLSFTIGDLETPVDSLVVGASAADASLVPTANIVLGGSGTSRTIKVTPAPDKNGATTVTVSVGDGTTTTTRAFNLTVRAVNDPPLITGGTDITVDEDCGAQTVAAWATIAPGPPTATDESGQSVAVEVTLNTSTELFSTQPSVAANGTLTFTPAANAFGAATIVVRARDNGGSSPGIDTSADRTFKITVNPINDTPVGTPQTVNTLRDAPTPITLTASDTENNPTTLSIVTQPANGTISNITSPNGPLGPMQLIYTPNAGYTGSDSFTFRGSDSAQGVPVAVQIQVAAPANATGVTRVWDGGAGTAMWATAANWVGDVAPQQGDSLQFPAGATGVAITQNNLPAGFVFDNITLQGNRSVTGNTINLLGGIQSSSSNSVDWNVAINFLANGFVKTVLSSPTGGSLTMQAEISTGPFNLTFEGAPVDTSITMPLTTTQRIFGTGRIISRGFVDMLNNSINTGVVSGGLLVETGELGLIRRLGTRTVVSGPVEIAAGAKLRIGNRGEINSLADPLDPSSSMVIRDGGLLRIPQRAFQRIASLQLDGGRVDVDSESSFTITGTVHAAGTGVSQIGIGSPNAALVFDGTGQDHVIDVATGARMVINAYSNAAAFLPVRKTGQGKLELNGRVVFSGGLVAQGGETAFFTDLNVGYFGDDASQTPVILDGGTVTAQSWSSSQFARRIGPLTAGPGGGVATPDPGFTEMRTGNIALTQDCTYRFDILSDRADPSRIIRDFDVTLAQGTVNLGNAQLEIIRPAGFTAPAGRSVVIIDNDGSDPVMGTFGGMPEGHTITNGNLLMQVTYVGGDGNDVAIRFNIAPTGTTRVWDGGGTSNNWSDAANWVGDFAPQLGDSLEFPSSAARLSPFNDYAFGSTFDQITFSGDGPAVEVRGNPLKLRRGVVVSGTKTGFYDIDGLLLDITALNDQSIVKTGTRMLTCSFNTDGHTLTLTDQVPNLPTLSSNPGIIASIGGSGDVIVNGTGSVQIRAGSPTHSGDIFIRSGFAVLVGSPNPRTGQTIIGGFGQPARLISFSSQVVDPAVVTTLKQGGIWELASPTSVFEPPIVQDINNLVLAGGSLLANANTRFVVRNSITARPSTDSTIQGLIRSGNPGGGSVALDVQSGASVSVSGAGTSIGQQNGSFFTKTGAGSLVIDAASETTTRFDLSAGTAAFNGGASDFDLNVTGGSLITGTSNPGILISRNLSINAAASFAPRIGGTAPGTGHDQIVVKGSVNLNSASLNATLIGNYIPTAGDEIILIRNDGTEAVSGTFSALVQGATVRIGDNDFTISYNGGDGNDVVLVASQTGTPVPIMSIEQPAGTVLTNNAPASSFGNVPAGTVSSNRVFTVRNAGTSALASLQISKTGAHANDYEITTPVSASIAAGSATTFNVSFAPKAGGVRNAQLTISSDDTNRSPFVVNLTGFGISAELDSDTDGLNDAAEFGMAALGFDFQSSQTNLVATLMGNANVAGLYTSNNVVTNPASFGLFNQAQIDGNRNLGFAQGKAEITNNPGLYGLFTSNSIMDLRMGGFMIQRQGNNAIVTFQPQTTTDLGITPFTNNGPPITNQILMPGNKGFIRIRANP